MSPQPRTVVDQDPVVVAVVAALTYDTFTAYDMEADAAAVFPYSVVYPLDDQTRSGPLWDGQADVVHAVQVTSVGETAEQARKLQDKNRAKILASGAITVSGRSVQQPDLSAGGGVERDEDEQPRLYYSVDIWLLQTSPA